MKSLEEVFALLEKWRGERRGREADLVTNISGGWTVVLTESDLIRGYPVKESRRAQVSKATLVDALVEALGQVRRSS